MTNTRIIDRHFLMHTKYLLQGNCLAEELHMVSLISIYDSHKLRKIFWVGRQQDYHAGSPTVGWGG